MDIEQETDLEAIFRMIFFLVQKLMYLSTKACCD